MDKQHLHQLINEALKSRYDVAYSAAQQAYETATHEENVAENKYDTLGLEASYLAEGQARRVAEAEMELQKFQQLSARDFGENDSIQFGAWIRLRDSATDKSTEVFLSPVAGGLTVEHRECPVLLVTAQAPLGKALLGAFLEDEVGVGDTHYLIEALA